MNSTPGASRRARRVLAATATVTVAASIANIAPTTARAQHDIEPTGGSVRCPGLYVLGVPGTGESSPQAPPAVDSGMLASILAPMARLGEGRLAGRAYVPYAAGFGGAVPGSSLVYSESAADGLARLRAMAESVLRPCPDTQLGLIGYSQGAHVVSMFAHEIGAGTASVAPDRVAAVALFADPTRAPGAAILPGRSQGARPDPAPGTAGGEVDAVAGFVLDALQGGGIGPLRDITSDFGALTGRVASLCLPGDLACDAPTGAPLLHMIVNILGHAELMPTDPVAALSSITEALSDTLVRTASAVVNHDLRGYSLGTLSLTPQKPLSVRLAEAADPRTDATPGTRDAVVKLGTSALNTLLAIIGAALTPAEVAAVLAAPDPLAALDLAAGALLTATRRPLPRRTVFDLVTKTFDALGTLCADNGELLDPAVWSRYAETARRHSDYERAAFTTDGRSATTLVLDWFTAVARDLAVPRPAPAPARAPEIVAAEPAGPPPPESSPGATYSAASEAVSGPATGSVEGYLRGLLVLAVLCACAAAATHLGRRSR